MKNKTYMIRCFILALMISIILSSSNALVCTDEMRDTFQFNYSTTVTPCGTVGRCPIDLVLDFNGTGNWTMFQYTTSGSNIIPRAFVRGVNGWGEQPNYTIGLPTIDYDGSFDVEYNVTGASQWQIFNAISSWNVTIYSYDGTNWTRNDTIDIPFKFHSEYRITVEAVSDFLGRPAVFVGNRTAAITAYTWNGSFFNRNTSLELGLPASPSVYTFTVKHNLTGAGRFDMVFDAPGTQNRTYTYNGSRWIGNNTYTLFNVGNGGGVDCIRNFNGTGNVTCFYEPTDAPGNARNWNSSTGWYDYDALLKVSSEKYNSTTFSGDIVNTSLEINVTCGAGNISIISNHTGSYISLYNFSTRNRNTFYNVTLNFTASAACNNVFGFGVSFNATRDKTTNLLSGRFYNMPYIFSNNASATANVSAVCNTNSNITVLVNETGFYDMRMNLSHIIIANNVTCLYGTNHSRRLEAVNTTYGCAVSVYGMNFTAGRRIGVYHSLSLSFGAPGNLPIAIVVATISALVVAYTVTRTRRIT